MEEIFRYRARRAFQLGRRTIPQGSLLTLRMVFDILFELLSLGLLEEIKIDGESKWVVLLRDHESWIRGEIVDKDDFPDWEYFKRRGWAVELYDHDISNEHVCGGCPKAFLTWESAIRHREETGHKRPYRKKGKKKVDQLEEEV